MDVAELILEYLRVLVWPLVVLLLLAIFRKRIPHLLSRIRSLTALGANLTFDRELRDARESIERERGDITRESGPGVANGASKGDRHRSELVAICRDLLKVIPEKVPVLDYEVDNGYLGLREVRWSVNAIYLAFGIRSASASRDLALVERTGVDSWLMVLRVAEQIQIVEPGDGSVLIGLGSPPTARTLAGRTEYLSTVCDEILRLLRSAVSLTAEKHGGTSERGT